MVEAAGLLEADDLVRAALGERRSMRSMTSASVEAASITSTHGTSSAGTDEERAGESGCVCVCVKGMTWDCVNCVFVYVRHVYVMSTYV
jgi:hypothetical protein